MAKFKDAAAEEREFWDAVYVSCMSGNDRNSIMAEMYADQALSDRRVRFGRIVDEVVAEAPVESRFERLG